MPAFDILEDRRVPSGFAAVAAGAVPLPVDPTVQVSGVIARAVGQNLYRVTLDAEGRLVAEVHASGMNTLLTLEDSAGNTLIQSVWTSPTDLDDRVAQHLPAGVYYLAVSGQGGVGGYDLSATFTRSGVPGTAIGEGQGAYSVTTADVNGDGKPDLIMPDYYDNQILINYGLGDGTFQPPVAITVGNGPVRVVAGQFSGDGHLDLAVVDQVSNDVRILDGDGRGNFRVSQVIPTGAGPVDLVSGDFSGDGRVDLAVAEGAADGVEVFRNRGDGTFARASWIGSILEPTAIRAADLDGDGRPDLVVASAGSGSLVLLDGEAGDRFSPRPLRIPVGPGASDVIAADVDGDGRPELIAVSPGSGTISIFKTDGASYLLRGTLHAGTTPEKVVAADFDDDGHLDLAASNYGSNDVSIFLGDGAGDFGPSASYPTGSGPTGLAASDLNGCGRIDLVTSDLIGLTLSVLQNNGDATFRSPPRTPPSAGPEDVRTADLNRDGIPDLVVPDVGLDEVSIFLGRGDGTFRDAIEVPAGSGPQDVTIGDFTGDGVPDLAVADYSSNSLTILQGLGDGTFRSIGSFATADGPDFIASADLDRDGRVDLIVGDYLDKAVQVFYGLGDGTFSAGFTSPIGLGPSGITVADFNGDGRPDIAVSASGSDAVDILLATGRRTFAPPASFAAGDQPYMVSSADFNGDDRADLIVANGLSSVVSVLLGLGDGTFGAPIAAGVGASPYPVAIGDFNGDGKPDVVVGNDGSNDLSVLLGRGDGTFRPELRLPGGVDPYGVTVADFNRDGRLDLVAVNFQSNDMTTYLGLGDGTFGAGATTPLQSSALPTITADLQADGVDEVIVANPLAGTITVLDGNGQGDGTLTVLTTIAVGGNPSGLAVADFNGDGRPDLAVTDAGSGEVLILLGLGDGTFRGSARYAVGTSPRSPVVGDFNRDGILDVAVANTGSDDVSVLLGLGDGTFLPQRRSPAGREPVSLSIGNGNGDGYLDLGTINRSSLDLTELVGLPGGYFKPVSYRLPGITASGLITGDFDGDGTPDVVIADALAGRLYVRLGLSTDPNQGFSAVDVGAGPVLLAQADLFHDGRNELIVANVETDVITILGDLVAGAFRTRSTIRLDVPIAGLAVADLNRDGYLDLLITRARTGQVETLLSDGDGTFSAAESAVPLPHPAPIIFPTGEPGVNTIVNLADYGVIRDRFGREGVRGEFDSPINQTIATGITIRDFAIVPTHAYPIVAALDAKNPLIYLQATGADGPTSFSVLHLPAGGNYTRMVAGDLFGDGLGAIVVINHSLNQVLVFRQSPGGTFALVGNPLPVGFGPTDVTLASIVPGGLPELVVADGSSGDVTLIGREAGGGFLPGLILPAGLAAAGTVVLPDGLKRTSPDQPVGVISAVFGPSGLADVVVVDHGTDRISILKGLPDGGLAAPSVAATYSTGLAPIAAVAAPLAPGGRVDLVVLNEGSHDISVFLNDGSGGFRPLARVDAGNNPTSIAIADITGDGIPDLVVSNDIGDILILSGNGDGTFQPYQRADRTVNLAVGDLVGDGQAGFVLSSTAQDLLTVRDPSSAVGFVQGRADGLLAPGPVAIADMNRDGIPDLVVTNTGGNDIFVYLGLGSGRYAPARRFFTGTAPLGLTVADLTGDGLPDLVVANSGSDDVTILLGMAEPDGGWTMTPGPRLVAGNHPISTTVADVYGDGSLDIVVVNQDDDAVSVLRGLGGGFFDDKDPRILAAGLGPVQAFVGHFSAATLPGLVILNSLSNDMTYYPTATANPRAIAVGGLDPVAGVIGDFNGDGYSDLAVANNGDARVNLFDGGPGGPSLVQSIYLGLSAHPTDLAVSSTRMGGLQFFVGAEGQDQPITVLFVSGTNFGGAGVGLAEGGLAATASNGHATIGGSSAPGGFSEAVFEEPGGLPAARGQVPGPAGGQPADVGGALGIASALFSTLTQVTLPAFAPSSRTLGWLIDNFLQLDQGQIAEILPIGKNEMAAVAVLLSPPGAINPLDEAGTVATPIPTGDDAPDLARSPADEVATPPPSRLDRYVAGLGDASLDFVAEVASGPGRAIDFGPDWVWNPRSTARVAISTPIEGRPAISTAEDSSLADPAPAASSAESTADPASPLSPAVAVGVAALAGLGLGIVMRWKRRAQASVGLRGQPARSSSGPRSTR